MNNEAVVAIFPTLAGLPAQSWNEFFRAYFLHNTPSCTLSAEQQCLFLLRSIKICLTSNRAEGMVVPTTWKPLGEHFLVRNRSGVCCHPIFISQAEYEEHGGEWEGNSGDIKEDDGHLEQDPDTGDRIRRSHITPLQKLAKRMLSCGMLEVRPQGRLKAGPRYPEVFHHGDILQLVVVPTSDEERARMVGWERNEGTFIWLQTALHPFGYPYSLAYNPDDYGCLPATVTFGEHMRPDSHALYITHNRICHPNEGIRRQILDKLQWLPLKNVCTLLNGIPLKFEEQDLDAREEVWSFLDEYELKRKDYENGEWAVRPASGAPENRHCLFSQIHRPQEGLTYTFFVGAFKHMQKLGTGVTGEFFVPTSPVWTQELLDCLFKGTFNFAGYRPTYTEVNGVFQEECFIVINPLVPDDESEEPRVRPAYASDGEPLTMKAFSPHNETSAMTENDVNVAAGLVATHLRFPSPREEQAVGEAQTREELWNAIQATAHINVRDSENRERGRKLSREMDEIIQFSFDKDQ